MTDEMNRREFVVAGALLGTAVALPAVADEVFVPPRPVVHPLPDDDIRCIVHPDKPNHTVWVERQGCGEYVIGGLDTVGDGCTVMVFRDRDMIEARHHTRVSPSTVFVRNIYPRLPGE